MSVPCRGRRRDGPSDVDHPPEEEEQRRAGGRGTRSCDQNRWPHTHKGLKFT